MNVYFKECASGIEVRSLGYRGTDILLQRLGRWWCKRKNLKKEAREWQEAAVNCLWPCELRFSVLGVHRRDRELGARADAPAFLLSREAVEERVASGTTREGFLAML